MKGLVISEESVYSDFPSVGLSTLVTRVRKTYFGSTLEVSCRLSPSRPEVHHYFGFTFRVLSSLKQMKTKGRELYYVPCATRDLIINNWLTTYLCTCSRHSTLLVTWVVGHKFTDKLNFCKQKEVNVRI